MYKCVEFFLNLYCESKYYDILLLLFTITIIEWQLFIFQYLPQVYVFRKGFAWLDLGQIFFPDKYFLQALFAI